MAEPHQNENEMRCPACSRWLGRASGVGTVVLRCTNCKAERVFVFIVPEQLRALLEQVAAAVDALARAR
jgi:phage FluMu protein Com